MFMTNPNVENTPKTQQVPSLQLKKVSNNPSSGQIDSKTSNREGQPPQELDESTINDNIDYIDLFKDEEVSLSLRNL
jgi:hypothetical protein